MRTRARQMQAMWNASLQRISPNAALLIDAAGCFAGAGVLLLWTSIWKWIDLPAHWRQPVVVALFLFAALLVIIARYPTRQLVAAAVLGNIVWITAGAIALFITGSLSGGIIIVLVMLADAIMAWFQAQALTGASVVAKDNIA